jgi:hypothetical protein
MSKSGFIHTLPSGRLKILVCQSCVALWTLVARSSSRVGHVLQQLPAGAAVARYVKRTPRPQLDTPPAGLWLWLW